MTMGNGTTTNFGIGGHCTGCLNGYERITNTFAAPTTDTNTGTADATCSLEGVIREFQPLTITFILL